VNNALLWPPRPRVVIPPKSDVQGWIDVSNWQGLLSPGWFDTWRGMGFGGLIVQAVTGDNGSFTRLQLQAALDAHWDIAGYIWCHPGQADNMGSLNNRLALFDGFSLDFLALDVEETTTRKRDVDDSLAACDRQQGFPTWVYTAKRVFDALGWSDYDWWAPRPLWYVPVVGYDGIADVDANFVPFGGWTSPTMKQFSETPVDQNVRRV